MSEEAQARDAPREPGGTGPHFEDNQGKVTTSTHRSASLVKYPPAFRGRAYTQQLGLLVHC